MEDDLIWLRVRRGWSQWKGLVGDGVLKPENKLNNNNKILPLLVCQHFFWVPERKGFLCILVGGLEGIRASKLTSEAPVGPRKASGVRHRRAFGAQTGGASRDRSDISGLDSCPFIWGLSRGSSPNGSGVEFVDVNGSTFTFVPKSSVSTEEEEKQQGGGGQRRMHPSHFSRTQVIFLCTCRTCRLRRGHVLACASRRYIPGAFA